MSYLSTNRQSPAVELKECILRSMPADNGLYLPENIAPLPAEFWRHWRTWDFPELSFHLAKAFLGADVAADELREMVERAITFDAPLVKLDNGDYLLELFHGPTLAFKDFGARFMARLMAYLTKGDEAPATVLAATSGDTGGAVASAFYNVPNTRAVLLYPKGRISTMQEKQIAGLGGNIVAIAIDGDFDACQSLVKSVFLKRDLMEKLGATSANSINFARVIAQTFYYFRAAQQLDAAAQPVFVVPSGNYGNVTAGLLAEKLGLQVRRFVAAANANDVVPRFLASGKYEERPTVPTISNAMDIAAPSNFARMLYLFDGDVAAMRARLAGCAFSDEETKAAIREVHAKYGYVIDPHGAIAWLGAKQWRDSHPQDVTVALGTAHPAKFPDVIAAEIGAKYAEPPPLLAEAAKQATHSIDMPADQEYFHEWLTSSYCS